MAYDIPIFRTDFRENLETTDQSVAHHHVMGRDGNCKSDSALKMSANIDKEELAYIDFV